MTQQLKLKPDEMVCIWWSPQTGTFEFMCGSEAADDLLNGGMQKINGKPVRTHVVGKLPSQDATIVRATTTVGERIDV